MYQNSPLGAPGMEQPDYLQKFAPGMAQQNHSAQDRARAALAGGLGMGGVTGQDGRFDFQKIGGMVKKFCV